MTWYRWDGADLVLEIRVQPRAKRDEFAAVVGERLRIRLAAPPVDGRANDGLVAFLAAAFGVTRAAVRLEQGAGGRAKRLRIAAPRTLPAALQAAGLTAPPARPGRA